MNKYVCANTISPSDLSEDEEGDVLGDEQQAARDEEDDMIEKAIAEAEDGNGEKGDNPDEEDLVCGPCDDDAQKPALIKAPTKPSAEDVATHNLTHMPYRSWCKHCVACRRGNAPHVSRLDAPRAIPLLVADYCYIRDSIDQDLTTVLVCRIYPWRISFATVVDMKGRDEIAIKRVSAFIKNVGMTHFAYRCDQEKSLLALLDEAILTAGRTAVNEGSLEGITGTPELSSVGESQSNGRAERGVQLVEDLMRTFKSALEARLGVRIPSNHPMMRWLVGYAASTLTKYSVASDGETGYQRLHGRKCREKLVELGEKVLYFVPKAQRSKMDKRYSMGIFLGRAAWGDVNFIGRADGSVTKSRALVRVQPGMRWNVSWFNALRGTPNELIGDENIEGKAAPHASADEEIEKVADGAEVEAPIIPLSMRLTKDICKTYGYTVNCPRCRFYQQGRESMRIQSLRSLSREDV